MSEAEVTWDFSYHAASWQPTRMPPADENLLMAADTLALSFGTRAWAVRMFLEETRKLFSSQPEHNSVNTTTASVRRAGADSIEIRDKYGQFKNVVIPLRELETLLSALEQKILTDFPESNRD